MACEDCEDSFIAEQDQITLEINCDDVQVIDNITNQIEVVVDATDSYDSIVDSDDIYEVIVDDSTIEVVTSYEQGPPGVGVPSGGTAKQVLVKQSGTDYDIGWEDLIIETGKPTDAYAICNTEDAGTYKYFGFENKDGAWYILRKTVATNIYLYVYGASNYSTGWTNRASHTYASYESTF